MYFSDHLDSIHRKGWDQLFRIKLGITGALKPNLHVRLEEHLKKKE